VDWIRFLLSGLCHQIPERSQTAGGVALPLCARCTGMYLGAAFTLLALTVFGQHQRSGLPRAPASYVLLAFIAAWGIDGANSTWALFTGQALIYPPDNMLRLATGFGAGFSIACALSPIYAGSFRDGADASPVLAPFWRLPAVLGLAGGTFTLVLLWQNMPLWLWTALLVAAVVNILAMVNAVVLRMVFSSRDIVKVSTPRTAKVIGAALCLLELAVLAFLKQIVQIGGIAY